MSSSLRKMIPIYFLPFLPFVLRFSVHLVALITGLVGILHGFQSPLATLEIKAAHGQHCHQQQKNETQPAHNGKMRTNWVDKFSYCHIGVFTPFLFLFSFPLKVSFFYGFFTHFFTLFTPFLLPFSFLMNCQAVFLHFWLPFSVFYAFSFPFSFPLKVSFFYGFFTHFLCTFYAFSSPFFLSYELSSCFFAFLASFFRFLRLFFSFFPFH